MENTSRIDLDTLREGLDGGLRRLRQRRGLGPLLAAVERQGGVLVGGLVRDLCLGRRVQDVDVVVPQGAEKLCRRLRQRHGGAALVPLDEQRGIWRLVLSPELYLDVADWQGASLEEDLGARDFTLNAMALRPSGSAAELIDPFHGLEDLSRGVLRRVSPRSFESDALRILRAARLGARLGLRLDPETRRDMQRAVPRLESIAMERIQAELQMLLETAAALPWLEELHGIGAFKPILRGSVQEAPSPGALRQAPASGPSLKALRGVWADAHPGAPPPVPTSPAEISEPPVLAPSGPSQRLSADSPRSASDPGLGRAARASPALRAGTRSDASGPQTSKASARNRQMPATAPQSPRIAAPSGIPQPPACAPAEVSPPTIPSPAELPPLLASPRADVGEREKLNVFKPLPSAADTGEGPGARAAEAEAFEESARAFQEDLAFEDSPLPPGGRGGRREAEGAAASQELTPQETGNEGPAGRGQPRLPLLWAALAQDLAGPGLDTRQAVDFFAHLRLPSKSGRHAAAIYAGPRRLERTEEPARIVRTLLALGEAAHDALLLARALEHPQAESALRLYRRHVEPFEGLPPLVGGKELLAAGLRPGPSIGRLLERIEVLWRLGQLRSAEEALAWARTHCHS